MHTKRGIATEITKAGSAVLDAASIIEEATSSLICAAQIAKKNGNETLATQIFYHVDNLGKYSVQTARLAGKVRSLISEIDRPPLFKQRRKLPKKGAPYLWRVK